MHTLRYNAAYDRWVLLGGVPGQTVRVQKAHLLGNNDEGDFIAAVHPENPFVSAPDDVAPAPRDGLVYVELPPVGEHELLLYRGTVAFKDWKQAQWEGWLHLLQHRLVMAHHNPYIHHLYITLDTAHLDGVEGYQRVGEMIASSHLLGVTSNMTPSIAEKLYDREGIFRIAEDDYGFLQVPSAPLHSHEIWYIPKNSATGIESVSGGGVQAVANAMSSLKSVYGDHRMTIRVHTCVSGSEHTWWLQAYAGEAGSDLAFKPRPEGFAQRLHLSKK